MVTASPARCGSPCGPDERAPPRWSARAQRRPTWRSRSRGPLLWAGFVERGPVRWARWRVVAALVLLVVAAILGVVQAMLAFVEDWSLTGAAEVLRDTAYGRHVHAPRRGIAELALVLARRRPVLTLALAIATTLTITLLGHAAVQTPVHVGHPARACRRGGRVARRARRAARTRRAAHGGDRHASRGLAGSQPWSCS